MEKAFAVIKYLFTPCRLHTASAHSILLLSPPPSPRFPCLPEQPNCCLHIPQLVPQHLGRRCNALRPITLQHSLVVIPVCHSIWMDTMAFHLKKDFDCNDRLVVQPTQLHEDAIADLLDRVEAQALHPLQCVVPVTDS